MTWPAAAVPSWPWPRISRVEARLSARRSIVAISSTVGKDENSSGCWMNSADIRMRTEKVIESARLISSSQVGIGRIRTDQDRDDAERQRDLAAPQRGDERARRGRPGSAAAVGSA